MSTSAFNTTVQPHAHAAEELEQLHAELFTPYHDAAKPEVSDAQFVEATFYDYSIVTIVDESSAC